MPKVSVIIPCFNAASWVGAALASVQAQSVRDWEALVVDDGSTDGSEEVVADIALRDPRVSLVRQVNRGVAAARNAGYDALERPGEYLLFLDADDELEPDMLEMLAGYLDGRPEVGAVYAGANLIDAKGDAISDHTPLAPRLVPTRWGVRELSPDHAETPFVSVFCLAGIIPSLMLVRRTIYEAGPGWDPDFGQHYEDTNLILALALLAPLHHLPRELVRHRRRPGQSTADPQKFAGQERKLYSRWRAPQNLTPEQVETVRAANRFRDRRLLPRRAVPAAARHARDGDLRGAVGFLGGAVRRAALSWLPERPNRRSAGSSL